MTFYLGSSQILVKKGVTTKRSNEASKVSGHCGTQITKSWEEPVLNVTRLTSVKTAREEGNRIIFVSIVVASSYTQYETTRGYSDEVKRECLKMYVNGMGFRGIERVKGVHHTTVITWVKQVGERLAIAYEPPTIPEVGEQG